MDSSSADSNRSRMLRGDLYRDNDPELVAARQACQRLVDKFNATGGDDTDERTEILTSLLGSIGEGSWIMPRFQCDYGTHISMGSNSFLNYDAILLDCASITIGENTVIGAGSVVTKDVPPHVFAAGNPCRVIRELP